VENAVRAEELGFDFVGISDHYAPWISEQGHSPFAWSILGAIAQATDRVGLMTGVTCPYRRYHPAIVAQAAATVALLSDGRFTLGLGSGELLNEHVVGELWPRVAVRHEYLGEALDIIRQLFEGGEQSYSGRYLELASVKPEDLEEVPHGPDAEPYLRKVEEFVEAGFDHVLLSQAGPDQKGFFEFFERVLSSELASRKEREPVGARSR
jgi:alkanesulfonate monooxygenase SsuD/methylene tetrahydromethanopterin reductase-like flavin-dependent oxidoreductase (luciferase family)